MALLALGASRCSICREVLRPGQAIVATTHFIADPALRGPVAQYLSSEGPAVEAETAALTEDQSPFKRG